MKNDAPVAQQACWSRRRATRAVDALALWGGHQVECRRQQAYVGLRQSRTPG